MATLEVVLQLVRTIHLSALAEQPDVDGLLAGMAPSSAPGRGNSVSRKHVGRYGSRLRCDGCETTTAIFPRCHCGRSTEGALCTSARQG